jgi:hypothetical protein
MQNYNYKKKKYQMFRSIIQTRSSIKKPEESKAPTVRFTPAKQVKSPIKFKGLVKVSTKSKELLPDSNYKYNKLSECLSAADEAKE